MVAVSSGSPNPIVNYDAWIESLARTLPETDFTRLRQACSAAGRWYGQLRRPSGELFLEHSLAVAALLAELRLDIPTLAAAVLHDVPELAPESDLAGEFGPEVAHLIRGLRRMDALVRRSNAVQQHIEDAEVLRKLLLSFDDDLRIILMKLAEQTHDLRSAKHLPHADRCQIAILTMEIYAPLANRLGMGRLKWELEDLAFRYLEPAIYQRIATLLDEKRLDREDYLHKVMKILRTHLAHLGIHAAISGRPKHLYSIWRKMRRKNVDFEHIYDVRALRVLVENRDECYSALGIVHSLWTPILGEFDDYIVRPKKNLYQSLHTAVIGPEEKSLEIQIRTHDMHHHAELGVAAHWRYKEGHQENTEDNYRIQWLRQFLERDATAPTEEFLDQFRQTIKKEQIYVFTPKGRVLELPLGATPLDFAYYIHTEIGHHCRGAKVDGHIVPLNYKLRNGDQIEILTAKHGSPSRDWLNLQNGYLHTHRARDQVRNWFKHAQNHAHPQQELTPPANLRPLHIENAHSQKASFKIQIQVQGVDNLVTHIAQCCNPRPCNPILGHITHHGISIHRADCINIQKPEIYPHLFDATWTKNP